MFERNPDSSLRSGYMSTFFSLWKASSVLSVHSIFSGKCSCMVSSVRWLKHSSGRIVDNTQFTSLRLWLRLLLYLVLLWSNTSASNLLSEVSTICCCEGTIFLLDRQSSFFWPIILLLLGLCKLCSTTSLANTIQCFSFMTNESQSRGFESILPLTHPTMLGLRVHTEVRSGWILVLLGELCDRQRVHVHGISFGPNFSFSV